MSRIPVTKNRIVELKQSFRPFTFYFPKKAAKTIIELPAGAIARSKSSLRDKVRFI